MAVILPFPTPTITARTLRRTSDDGGKHYEWHCTLCQATSYVTFPSAAVARRYGAGHHCNHPAGTA